MLNNLIYRKYLETEKAYLEQKKSSEQEKKQNTADTDTQDTEQSRREQELHSMVAEGMEYIRHLRDLNDRIEGEAISEKLYRLENLLKEIAQADPAAYRFAVADVTRPAETVAALEHLAQELGGMDLCVVCAGTGDLNPSLDFALEETAILTNVLGWTAAADWAYNRFERQGGGHLVVVSSVGGLRGGGAAPAYNASKAYQINYAEGLRQRAAKSRLPLYITDVRPGFVDTAMAKGDGLFWVMPVEKAVRQIVRAVRRRRRVAVVTRRWRIAAWLLRHMPDGIYLKM